MRFNHSYAAGSGQPRFPCMITILPFDFLHYRAFICWIALYHRAFLLLCHSTLHMRQVPVNHGSPAFLYIVLHPLIASPPCVVIESIHGSRCQVNLTPLSPLTLLIKSCFYRVFTCVFPYHRVPSALVFICLLHT